MNKLQRYIICVFVLFILFGCNGGIQKALQKCPGKTNVTEALAALQSQSQNMIPISAKGKFSFEYYEKDEKHKHHFNISPLLIRPPHEIYMQASTGVIQKAVVLAANEQEFWLELKPKEISKYWWGLWSEQNSNTGLMINPGTLLEALGIAEIDTQANWTLSNDGIYDVLTKTVNGVTVKILHVYCCDYHVRKIEYFDNGSPTAIVKMDDYKEVSPGFFVPVSITVNSLTENIEQTLNLDLTLKSIKPAAQKHMNFAIVRREPQGFEHVYRVRNGQLYEQ